MAEFVANFTLNQNNNINATFDLSEPENFDALFQINATPDITGLATKQEVEEVSDTINDRIDGIINALDEEIETLNDRINTMVQDVQGSGTVDVTRTGQNITVATKTFVFEQGFASDTWVVDHNLNKYPSVELVDSAGQQFKAQVEYDTLNRCTVYLNGATTGKAYLN